MFVKSHAKVNLILSLGDKNSSGRFETHFIMQEIGLHDDIEIEAIGHSDIIIECNDPSVPLDENNLCHKAVRIIQELSGRAEGVKISITKRIPAAGGLGGGSSNAAAVLKALNGMWKVGLADNELIKKINPHLGTDTSFFIKGGTAEVKRNGLEVKTIETDLHIPFIFVLPEIDVPDAKTANVYEHFKPERVSKKPDIDGMISALENGSLDAVATHLYNAFEYSLPPHYASVPDIKKDLIDAGCINAIMCGAGPTVFGVCESSEGAKGVARAIDSGYVILSETKNPVD